MATLWGFESLPGHQATLNADCPAPSIKTKTYTPGATQLHQQHKNSGSPRTTRGILSSLLPFGSSHVTCGKPSLPPISSPFQIVQQRFACFLSGRQNCAAARQHCSTFCSMFPSMSVAHTRLASHSGSLPPCAHPSGALKLPRAPGNAVSLAAANSLFFNSAHSSATALLLRSLPAMPSTFCAHPGSARTEAAL